MITRFAPSPTGNLHLGHVASALFAAKAGGKESFILRIEDIDGERCKPQFTHQIYEDLAWLGFDWPKPVRIQSEHMDFYKDAFQKLDRMGLLYPCYCTRKEIRKEAMAAGQAPHANDIGFIYTGTCKKLTEEERDVQKREPVWRLDMKKAIERVGADLTFFDKGQGEVKAEPHLFGDVVMARRDIPTCYHLSVTLDDALQGIELVTRGQDLFVSTHVHRLLQALLDLPVPAYHHHPLLTDPGGQRLAKRDGAIAVKTLHEAGESSESVLKQIYNTVTVWFDV